MSENDRYETYKTVPAGYDFRNAPPGDLDLYGIPPPEMFVEPRLRQFREKLISPPFHPRPPSVGFIALPFQTSPPTTLESSLNWSGAVVSPPWPKRITLAVAGWTVPTVTRPAAPALFTPEDVPKTLVWVGLDGHKGRLPKISLPQIGTAHMPDSSPTHPQHFAWVYWWHNMPDDTVREIKDFVVRPGDEIMAGLYVLPSDDVALFIKNQTTGEYCPFLAKRQLLPDIEPLGSSAEWIVERPTDPTSLKLFPLANYGSVNFSYCMALAADRPLAPGRVMTLADNGRIVKMREAFANPYRTAYVSRATRRRDADGSISVTCTFHEPV